MGDKRGKAQLGCVCAVQSCRVSAGMWREVNRVFGGTEKETKTKEELSVENAVKENEEKIERGKLDGVIVRTEIRLPADETKLAFLLDNVLTDDECRTLIKETESIGYEPALLNIGGGNQVLETGVRNSERCILDSKERAAWIWDRLRPFVPRKWKDLEVVGLNERLRFLKYSDGQYFKPHYDGTYTRPDGSETSYITIQVAVIPRAGRVLVFQHNVLHEGSTLISGTKYAMRTDVMYKCKELGWKNLYSKA